MPRTKSTPTRRVTPKRIGEGRKRRHALVPWWSNLPNELRRIILGYAVVDAGTYFKCLDSSIDTTDGSFFHTGRIRVRTIYPDGTITILSYSRNDDSYRRSLQPGVRVFRHAEDLRQCKLWECYVKSLVGTRTCAIASLLDSTSWEPPCSWNQSCRLRESRTNEAKTYRSENQVIGTITQSNCKTHTFYLGLVCEKLLPKEPWLYARPVRDLFGPNSSIYGIRCGQGNPIRLTHEETHGMVYWKDCSQDSEGSVSSDEEDSEYESEYDSDTGEKIESIRLADYDESDRLYFLGRREPILDRVVKQRVCPKFKKQRVPNAHLKSDDGTTIFEPLSWRLSVNPKWRSIHCSNYEQLEGETSMVIGRRHEFLEDIEPVIGHLWENEWTAWDDTRPGTFEPPTNLEQYYHVGIVDAYEPQPSFVELSKNPCMVVVPLMDALAFENETEELQMSHYTLDRGLKSPARYLDDIDFQEAIVDDADALYI